MVKFGDIYLYADYRTNWEDWHCNYQREYRKKKSLGIPTGWDTKAHKEAREKRKQANILEEKAVCKCGGKYGLKTSKYNHVKSKKHINYLNQLKFQDNLSTDCVVIEP